MYLRTDPREENVRSISEPIANKVLKADKTDLEYILSTLIDYRYRYGVLLSRLSAIGNKLHLDPQEEKGKEDDAKKSGAGLLRELLREINHINDYNDNFCYQLDALEKLI